MGAEFAEAVTVRVCKDFLAETGRLSVAAACSEDWRTFSKPSSSFQRLPARQGHARWMSSPIFLPFRWGTFTADFWDSAKETKIMTLVSFLLGLGAGLILASASVAAVYWHLKRKRSRLPNIQGYLDLIPDLTEEQRRQVQEIRRVFLPRVAGQAGFVSQAGRAGGPPVRQAARP